MSAEPKAVLIDRDALPTDTFDWGMMKWLVTPSTTPGAQLTFGEVIVLPGGGHSRHNHPDAEEILYFLSGEAEQMLDDGEPFRVRAGDVVYIPVGVYHSTINVGWEPMRVIAIYNPGGSELGLQGLPDFAQLPPNQPSTWTRP
jgi:oxalate decarboxylase/phosphoglucose isomerase-like protein (cupin superfamily)